MKQLKTILAESSGKADEYEYLADAERTGEISRNTYYRACATAGLSRSAASECLRENYQRAGLGHIYH